MRLSYVESCQKDKEESHKGSNHNAPLLSLTLTVGATLYLATLDATACAVVGIFFRLQVVEFDIRFLFLVSHVCYLSFVGLFVDCVVSVAPNSNRCPPVTSCFGIRSFKRNQFIFPALRLLIP